jgi:flagellar FliL protein
MIDEKMDDKDSEGEGASKSGKLPIVLIGAVLVALLIGAGGAYIFIQPQKTGDAAGGELNAEELVAIQAKAAEVAAASNVAFQERVYSLEPFVVNVTGDGYSRYLKVKIDLEGESVLVKDEVAAHLPQVRDAIIGLLSSKQLSDITDLEGKTMLKDDIALRVNDLLTQGDVKSVLFTEFVVQ